MATGMTHSPLAPRQMIAESGRAEPQDDSRSRWESQSSSLSRRAGRWRASSRSNPTSSAFLDQTAAHWFPMHHTLFMTFGRVLGLVCGDPYRGFILLDMLTSAARS